MQVLLDARTVGRQFSGVGFYVLELVRAFASLPHKHTIHLLVHGDSALDDLPLDDRFRVHRAPFSPENHPLGDLWEDFALPRLARKLGADVLHGPAFLIPLRRTVVPNVVTIHDLVAFTHPETIPWKYAFYMRWLIRNAVRSATHVVCDAQSVKREIVARFGTESAHITAIHLGVHERFRPQDREQVDEVRRRHGITRPYLLFVGNLEPRKNLPGLLQAFRLVRAEHAEPIELVVAGQVAWKSGGLLRELGATDVREHVRLLGYVPAGDLPALYSDALAFVLPTLWEGFGLPVLEAMACGTPVVASRVESIVEIAGEAATLVDPTSPESIADGIRKALDERGRAELVRRSRECAARFTWRETARRTLDVYDAARKAARA